MKTIRNFGGLLLLSILISQNIIAQSFTELNQTFSSTWYGAAVWADFDKDGHLDFFANGWSSSGGSTSLPSAFLYRNNGDGTFSEISTSIIPLGAATASWGDFNNDGYPDLAVAGNSGSSVYATRIYRNNGDGTFTDIQAGLTPVITPSIAWGDLNNDGFQDIIVVGGNNASDGTSIIYLNNGNETFTEITSGLVNLTNGAVAIGDLNNDGWADIVIAGRIGSFDYTTKVYMNQGDAVFTELPVALEPARYSAISLADYSGDGFLDILISGSNNSDVLQTRLYKNIGGTGFQFVPTPMTGVIQGSVAFGDMNNDGLIDVILTGSNVSTGATRVTEIYLNQGNDVFTKFLGFAFPGLRRSTAYWGDYNNDGKLDVLVSGYFNVGDFYTKIYTNNTPIANTPPLPPGGLQASVSGGGASLSWLSGSDNQTAESSLTYNVRIGSSPGGTDIVSPIADPSTGNLFLPEKGNAGTHKGTILQGLDEGTYYWSVQTVDGAFEGSVFANEQVFTISDLLTATFQVISDGQNPLEGAIVQIGSQQKETDENGVAVFNLTAGTFNFTVSHPFHISQAGNFTISDQSVVIPVNLVSLPTFTLTFALTGSSGALEDALIEIAGQTLITNAQGQASLILLEGLYPYYIYAEGYNQIWDNVNVSANTLLSISMVPIAVQDLPLTELFDANILPLHWQTLDDSESGYNWFFEDGRAIIDSDLAGQGVNVRASLITPPVNTSALVGRLKISFKHFFNRSGTNNFARVQYSADNNPWVQVAEFNSVMGTINNFVLTELIVDNIAGQASQVRFRFEYDDGFAWSEQWMIDEVTISEFNLQPYQMTISDLKTPKYASTPLNHFSPFNFGAKGENTGINGIPNLHLNIYDGNGNVANSNTIAFFPAGIEFTFTTNPVFVPTQSGEYYFYHHFLATGIDLSGPTNEAMLRIFVSDSVFSTEYGELEGAIGGSNDITFGNLYQLLQTDRFRSFTIGWHELTNSLNFTVSLFEINMADSTIISEVYTSPEIFRDPSMTGQYITWHLPQAIELAAGYYALMVNQTGTTSVRVGYDGANNGLFWRKSENNLTTFENTQWGNVAIRMNVKDAGVGISETENLLISVYPNPVVEKMTLNYMGNVKETAFLYDVSGNKIASFEITPGNNTIDVSSLSNGVYFIKLKEKSVKMVVQK
ncbi:MAG: T9SS type A sorting domain-containing protein [Bacteroidales bacterium]|nr:T9SS type A sorting domain-containing protein [Bacteroidales bacterium]